MKIQSLKYFIGGKYGKDESIFGRSREQARSKTK